jgi:hypothetical protein
MGFLRDRDCFIPLLQMQNKRLKRLTNMLDLPLLPPLKPELYLRDPGLLSHVLDGHLLDT